MKHFIILIHYLESPARISEIRPRHRKFLEKAYEQGIALFSGPQAGGKGGIIAARGKSFGDVEIFFKDDPYLNENVAKYQIIEFEPGHYQSFLENWIKG